MNKLFATDFFDLSYKDHELNETKTIQMTDEILSIINCHEIVNIEKDFKIQASLFSFLSFYFNDIIFNEYYGFTRNLNPFSNEFDCILLNEYSKLIKRINFIDKASLLNSLIDIINEEAFGNKLPMNEDNYMRDIGESILSSSLLVYFNTLEGGEALGEQKEQLKTIYHNSENKRKLYKNKKQDNANHLIKTLKFYLE